MEKTWIAVHRRSEQELALQACYETVFSALAAAPKGLGPNVVIPETAIFSHQGWQLFTFDPQLNKVVRRAASSVTSSRIVTAMFNDAGGGDAIAAVWLSEKKDARGMLVAAEYLTNDDLEDFFQLGERHKLGVLQRFVEPRPYKAKDNFNNEIVAQWAGGEVTYIERRSTRYPLDGLQHPTQRAAVFLPVAVTGKIAALTLPFSPHDLSSIYAESITNHTFAGFVGKCANRIVEALHALRPKGNRGVSALTAHFKFGRDDGLLYFLGLLALRYPAESGYHDLSFELAKVNKLAAAGIVDDDGASGDFETAPSSVSIPSATLRYDPDEDFMDVSPSRYVLQLPPEGQFSCQNCGVVHEKEDFLPVPFRTIVAFVESKAKHEKQTLSKIFPRNPLATFNSSGAQVKVPRRPQSARIVSSVEKAKNIVEESPLFKLGHDWVELPPVLKRLNVPLESMSHRPVWMERTTPLCVGCATLFGFKADNATDAQPREEEKEQPTVSPTKQQKRPVTASRKPVPVSEIVGSIVTSDLQLKHRAIRTAERDKAEMEQAYQEFLEGGPSPNTEEQEQNKLNALLSSLQLTDADGKLGPGPDIPLYVLLCNELHAAMVDAVKPRGEPIVVPRSLSRPSAFGKPFPQPAVLVDTAVPETLRAEAVGQSTQAERKTFCALVKQSTTFGDLSRAERRLLVEVVGSDLDRFVDDEFDEGEEADIH